MKRMIVDLALEKGLEDYVIHVWKEHEPGYLGSVKNYEWLAVLSVIQKWLREEHNIHIEIFIEDTKPYNKFYHRIIKIGQYFTTSYDDDISETYEQALEKGLQKALQDV